MTQKATFLSSFPAQIFEKTGKIKRDKPKINIRGIVVFHQDLIIISDFMNGIKSFNSTGKPLCKLRNPSIATAMTKMSDSRIAFLIPWDCFPETILVDVNLQNGELTLVQRIHTRFNYRAIAAIDEQTWVNAAPWWNGGGKIDMFNLNGEILKSFHHPNEKDVLLKNPVDMVVTPSGYVVVTDEDGKILGVDPKADDNHISFEFVDSDNMDSPTGISSSCDSFGRIYVADSKRNHVIMMSSDGKFMQTILDAKNAELCEPSAVCVFEDKLYIAERRKMCKDVSVVYREIIKLTSLRKSF